MIEMNMGYVWGVWLRGYDLRQMDLRLCLIDDTLVMI